MYTGDNWLYAAGTQTLNTLDVVEAANVGNYVPANGAVYPKSPLGGNFASELNATRQLQEAFRRPGLPIAYTTIGYAPDLRDGGLFVKKVPSLAILQRGSPLTEK